MGNFNLTNLAVNMYCPGNAAQLDDAGLPSIMVWIPAFRLCDVLNTTDESMHPAFIVNGVQIPGFWYSKYENVVHNGKAYSLPGEDPVAKINYDTSKELSEAKGYGWHLSTATEWAAIALWCMKNGSLPYGNARFGKDSRESEYKAIPTSNVGDSIGRVATGTGPLTWSHDGSMSGIWDLHGNVAEWQSGIRIVWGEVQILANNDAADADNPTNSTSVCWKAIKAADGSLVDPECVPSNTKVKASGSTVKIDLVDGAWVYSTNIKNPTAESTSCTFGSLTADSNVGDAALLLLRSLALLPDDGTASSAYESDKVYLVNKADERLISRGGGYSGGTDSGLFGLYTSARHNSTDALGFRAAYIPNI